MNQRARFAFNETENFNLFFTNSFFFPESKHNVIVVSCTGIELCFQFIWMMSMKTQSMLPGYM